MDNQAYELARYGIIAAGTVGSLMAVASIFKSLYLRTKSNNETAVARINAQGEVDNQLIETRTRSKVELQSATDKANQMKVEQLRLLMENPALKDILVSNREATEGYLQKRKDVLEKLQEDTSYSVGDSTGQEIDDILGCTLDQLVKTLPLSSLTSLEGVSSSEIEPSYK